MRWATPKLSTDLGIIGGYVDVWHGLFYAFLMLYFDNEQKAALKLSTELGKSADNFSPKGGPFNYSV